MCVGFFGFFFVVCSLLLFLFGFLAGGICCNFFGWLLGFFCVLIYSLEAKTSMTDSSIQGVNVDSTEINCCVPALRFFYLLI